MRSRRTRKVARPTTEIIDWMRTHTIGDLKDIASRTEMSGGDASSMRQLLTDIESLQQIAAGMDEFNMANDSGVLAQ